MFGAGGGGGGFGGGHGGGFGRRGFGFLGAGLGLSAAPYLYDDYYGYPDYGTYGSYGYSQPYASQYWYYCQNPAGYYPHVPQCSVNWQPVPAG